MWPLGKREVIKPWGLAKLLADSVSFHHLDDAIDIYIPKGPYFIMR